MVVFYCIGTVLGFFAVLAIWVVVDSLQRGGNPILWGLGTLFLAPIIFPVYFAKRPLKGDEIRVGGPDWLVAQRFVPIWTLFMLILFGWTLYITLTGGEVVEVNNNNDAAVEQAQAISRGVALFFIFLCWLVPALAAWVMSPALFDHEAEPEYGPNAIHFDDQEAIEIVDLSPPSGG